MDLSTVMRRPFIVAEMGANHNGSLERAFSIIDAAADAGADAIKLQTWQTGYMVLDRGYIIQRGHWAGKNLTDLYREAWTPWAWHEPIFTHAKTRGLLPFSTPFDLPSLEFLESCNCGIYKIASFEIVDLALIDAVARTGKPMIISTGMATFEEIHRAWDVATDAGCEDITLLKCSSAYPADASNANLAAMQAMRRAFTGCSVGLSDHTMGNTVAVAATAMGAEVIEKHLTLSRADGGLDASFSMEPGEFRRMVKACRTAAAAIGEVKFGPMPGEHTDLRRSLWLVEDIAAGEIFEPRHIRSARPAFGMECRFLGHVIGAVAKDAYKAGQPLKIEMVK